MFHKVIIGFDGTDTGHDGLALSMGLAKAFGSHVVVAYVYDEELSATPNSLSTPRQFSRAPASG